MQDFIGDLIDSVGVSIWAPEFEGLLEKRALDPSLEQRALKLAFEMGSPERPWFWKDAMLISVIPFLRRVFPEAVYLITLRNPHDSASSYEKLLVPEALRGKIRLVEYTYLRWQHFMLTIFEELKNYKGRLLVPYETLVSSPREQCTRISRFLDTEYGLTEGAGVRIERMEQSINPRLWRNRSRVSFLDREDAPSVSKELFAYLLSRVDGDLGDFDPSKYPLPEWSREYCSNMSVMGWLLNSL